MFVAVLREICELRISPFQHFFVACPALQCGAREAIELELEIWVAENRGVEGERVRGTGSRSFRSMRTEGLSATEEVAKLGVDVGVGL